jgi:hypothetical protein
MEEARLEDADLTDATLRMCVLDGARAMDACLAGARLEDGSARGADLSRADLRGAHLSETSLARAVLRDADLSGVEGDGVELRGADLRGAKLAGARLADADLRGADLRGADLSGGHFQDADFRGALVEGARFDDADVTGAAFDDGAAPGAGAPVPEPSTDGGPFAPAVTGELREQLAAFARSMGVSGGAGADLVVGLEKALAALQAAPDDPPPEWRQWLEPLIERAKHDNSLDVKSILQAIAAASGRHPSKPPAGGAPPA